MSTLRVVLALAAAGCGAPLDRYLGPPPSDGMKTLWVAVTKPDLQVEAIDLEAPHPYRLEIETTVTAEEPAAFALLFPDTLASRQLSAGPIAADSGNGIEFGDEPVTYAAAFDAESEEVSWQRTMSVPAPLRDFRVATSEECATFGAPTTTADVDGDPTLTVALDGIGVLISTTARNTYLVNRSGIVDITNLAPANLESAVVLRDRVYFGDAFGRIYSGRASASVGIDDVELLATTSAGPWFTMDGGVTESGVELVLVSRYAEIGFWNEDGFVMVGAVPSLTRPVVWAGPGDAYIADRATPGSLHHLRRDGVTTEDIGTASVVMSMGKSPVYGLLAATADGEFLEQSGAAWRRIEGPGFGWWGLSMDAYEDGFIYLLASGFFGQNKRSRGFCENFSQYPIIEQGEVLVTGRDVVLIGELNEVHMTRIVYLPR